MSALWRQLFVAQLKSKLSKLAMTDLVDKEIDYNGIRNFKLIACVAIILRINNEFYKHTHSLTNLDMNTVFNGNLPLDMLFIRRAFNKRDTNGGDLAFPGGKFEAEDKFFKNALEREVREEIGIGLKNISNYTYMGTLPAYEGFSYNGKLKLLPFIFLQAMDFSPTFALNTSEIRDVLWVNFSQFVRKPELQNMQEFKQVWNEKYGNARNDDCNCFNTNDDGVVWKIDDIEQYSWQFIAHGDKDFQLFLKRMHAISPHFSMTLNYKFKAIDIESALHSIVLHSRELDEYVFLWATSYMFMNVLLDVLKITHFMQLEKMENINEMMRIPKTINTKNTTAKIRGKLKKYMLASRKVFIDFRAYPYFYKKGEDGNGMASKL